MVRSRAPPSPIRAPRSPEKSASHIRLAKERAESLRVHSPAARLSWSWWVRTLDPRLCAPRLPCGSLDASRFTICRRGGGVWSVSLDGSTGPAGAVSRHPAFSETYTLFQVAGSRFRPSRATVNLRLEPSLHVPAHYGLVESRRYLLGIVVNLVSTPVTHGDHVRSSILPVACWVKFR